MSSTLINRVNPDQRPVSLDVAKKQIRVTHTIEDEVILIYVDSAIEYCEDYTNTMIQLSLCKTFFKSSSVRLTGPVRAISSVNYMDVNGNKQQVSDYSITCISGNGAIVEITNMLDSQQVWVEYIAGYGDFTPDSETVVNETIRPMPVGLLHCILLLLSFDFINRSSKTDFQKHDTGRVDEMLDQHVVYE